MLEGAETNALDCTNEDGNGVGEGFEARVGLAHEGKGDHLGFGFWMLDWWEVFEVRIQIYRVLLHTLSIGCCSVPGQQMEVRIPSHIIFHQIRSSHSGISQHPR